MLKIKPIAKVFYLAGSLLLPMTVHADYAAQIIDPSSGYVLKVDNNSTVDPTPYKGSDGQNYYQVGDPITLDSTSAQASGIVKCVGRRWGGNSTQILSTNSFHRLFMYVPTTGISIGGKETYRINSNVVMTVEADIMQWTNRGAGVCSLAYEDTKYEVPMFNSQFPITMTFYINERIIDGQLMIYGMDLAGYVRAFTDPLSTPPFNSWPLNEVSVPLRLATSQINVGAMCSTSTSSGDKAGLNLRHGQLNSLNYDSRTNGQVTYSCLFSSSTKVRLRLDYASDEDPQKRLPMTNNANDKIYSALTIIDQETGQSGQELRTEIYANKTFEIISHLQGENAAAGDYHGSAWLIATYE